MESITAHIALTDELIAIRRHLHAHPERSFHEVETSAYLERVLRGHGVDVLANPMETGVVAQITGEHPGPTSTACRSTRIPDSISRPSTPGSCTAAATTCIWRACSARCSGWVITGI